MGKRNKSLQMVILGAIILLGGFAIGSALFANDSVPVIGSKVPNIKLQQLNGDVQELNNLKGQAVVLNFWGTWCEPCTREMPAFQRAHEEWKDKGVSIIAVNNGEDPITVNNYVNAMNITFPIWLDSKKSAAKAYGIRPLPTTFFIKPDGTVHNIILGEVEESVLKTQIKEITS
ncbi:thiol-disulfide oxidoreductase ResA [Paenibacillus sp. SC116]|uniref:thiol-disulfide oxidoreductase ResA n=1 Tax=Paenibacillus sp. SC116 TaxID=2968986 RepID=UPI00215A2263|nr:thiol-disulfide oxidoreductase ResA [Paenibacillus sp. SC116]MCR8843005.1 thiol-disulfide oxidoreductase ResA [Paenibacillus sp. SC116]